MTPDVIALRAHLVAEAERAKTEADEWQAVAATSRSIGQSVYDSAARTATDAWLAADARLRALDGLIAARQRQLDAYELQTTGTFARGRWYTRDEIAALTLAPCEGDTCQWRECLPCGLRRMPARQP